MDGPSVEHSDSDSGESWTLLENASIYADEPPEFIGEPEKHGAQHHEKDEDTDGISVISDSDHEAPSPTPGDAVYENCPIQEKHISEKDISDYVAVDPHLSNIDDDDREPAISEDFLGDTHARHKTYVHRRNKRLSTVLNIIVLGSVITAAGVAIGHMWGAKNDCTMQTTTSVNKILSNLYKLQEENAYLRGKLKELTNLQMQDKIPLKHTKCKKVFEESLSNYDPRKLTKCVDENNKKPDNSIDHIVKPKFEKEFVADIDKLKTVYLQNKSWLDDEISRRMKIEEELLKKYNDEVKSAKELKNQSVGENNDTGFKTDANMHKQEDIFVLNKVTYADSLKGEQKPRYRRNEERYENDEDNYWLTSGVNKDHFGMDDNYLSESVQKENTAQNLDPEEKPQTRRNEERYESDYDNSFIKDQAFADEKTADKPKFRRNEERYETEGVNWSRYTKVRDTKNMRNKEKRNPTKNASKQSSETKNNNSNEDMTLQYSISEDEVKKDNRYVINKLKQEKKKNGYINSNKKQKRKNKYEKWNMKGEFGENYEAVENAEDFVLNYPDKNHNIDYTSFTSNMGATDKSSECYKDVKCKSEKYLDKGEKNEKKSDKKEQDANWFEKRAIFRTEARKKYYAQLKETSPNNSSWYFRRMRKREQCRARGDNSTSRNIHKEKKNHKMKH